MKIITVIGARPQFIKAAVASQAMRQAGIQESILHTGQHFDTNMSAVFFEELQLGEPAFHLGIGGGTHGQNTGRMIEAIEQVLMQERPDGVLVYGDTDSTLAGSVAAVKLHVPVAHVEAGLRSFNRRMPEEINRILTDHAADLLFPPTQTAVDHLVNEGISMSRIHMVGDVMFDAALHFGAMAEQQSNILTRLELNASQYVLATIHRAENTDDPARLQAILDGFGLFGESIVLPIHPRTRLQLTKLKMSVPSNVKAVDPVGFLDMVMLERHASLIATDSGGVQKEAFFHGVPCVTLREETEWTELVDAGWNRLVAPASGGVIANALQGALGTHGRHIAPYGDGRASKLIADTILATWKPATDR